MVFIPGIGENSYPGESRVSDSSSSGFTPRQHGRYSNDRGKGSVLTNNVRYDDAIGTPDTTDITHDGVNVADNGSVFTVVNDGWYDIDLSFAVTEEGVGASLTAAPTVISGGQPGLTPLIITSAGAGQVNNGVTKRYLTAGTKIYVGVTGTVFNLGTSSIDGQRILITRVA